LQVASIVQRLTISTTAFLPNPKCANLPLVEISRSSSANSHGRIVFSVARNPQQRLSSTVCGTTDHGLIVSKLIRFTRGQLMLAKLRLLGFGGVLGWLLMTSPAAAQAQSDAEKMERLERQVDLLQKQLKAVQGEIKATKKKTEKAQAKAVPAVNAATPNPAPTPISTPHVTSQRTSRWMSWALGKHRTTLKAIRGARGFGRPT
jgi:hypothetical protein